MTKYLFVILFTGMSQVTVAQDYAFKVLISKGDNEVRSGQQWMPVKVGSSLSSEDELKVPENSYLGLVHISGKTPRNKRIRKLQSFGTVCPNGKRSQCIEQIHRLHHEHEFREEKHEHYGGCSSR